MAFYTAPDALLLLFPQRALQCSCFFLRCGSWLSVWRGLQTALLATGVGVCGGHTWAARSGCRISSHPPRRALAVHSAVERAVVITSRVIVVHSPPCPATTPVQTPYRASTLFPRSQGVPPLPSVALCLTATMPSGYDFHKNKKKKCAEAGGKRPSGSHLVANRQALSIQCKVCFQVRCAASVLFSCTRDPCFYPLPVVPCRWLMEP